MAKNNVVVKRWTCLSLRNISTESGTETLISIALGIEPIKINNNLGACLKLPIFILIPVLSAAGSITIN